MKNELIASPQVTFAATFSDGSASAFHLDNDDNMEELVSWSEPRLKEHQRFVGLSVSNRQALYPLQAISRC